MRGNGLSVNGGAGSSSAVGRARATVCGLRGHKSSSVGGCGAMGSASGRMEVGNRVGWGWVIEKEGP